MLKWLVRLFAGFFIFITLYVAGIALLPDRPFVWIYTSGQTRAQLLAEIDAGRALKASNSLKVRR